MRSQLSLREKSSMRVSNGSKAGLFRHGQPTAHLVKSLKCLRHFAANSAD
jgi:hypothetical protein